MAEALADPRPGKNSKLAKIDALIDWPRLEPVLREIRSGTFGRPPFAPLSMLKALYLQTLYGLSDPGLEEALLDRTSFRAFCRFSLEDKTPDETTFCRFRADAAQKKIVERCLEEINRQLETRGLMLKKGTLMDATIVAAAHNPPPREAGMGSSHEREVGADWINKNGKSYFGYKLHIGAEEGSLIIRKAVFTPARTQDGEMFEALLSGDEKAVYADRAYESKARRTAIKARGIKDRIMHRRHKHLKHLPARLWQRNGLIARRRAPVEAVFSAPCSAP